MKVYLLSLGAGLLVGVVYGLINVRSPAPPVIALIGLLGILLGEQAVPIAKRLMAKDATRLSVQGPQEGLGAKVSAHQPHDAGQG